VFEHCVFDLVDALQPLSRVRAGQNVAFIDKEFANEKSSFSRACWVASPMINNSTKSKAVIWERARLPARRKIMFHIFWGCLKSLFLLW